MNGNNTITLCSLAMQEALQAYLNEHVFTEKNRILVIGLKEIKINQCETYEITVAPDQDNIAAKPKS